jgi:23S rRNA (uracil1939-C5)-methyltransferase
MDRRPPRSGPAADPITELVECDIDSLDASGNGVGRVGRRQVAVPFTLPGERVRVRLSPDHRTPATTALAPTLVAIVRPSPHRVAPNCAHFGRADPVTDPCGGCAWQHISYAEQLRLKTATVERLIRAAVPSAPATRPMLPSTPLDAPWAYRHKVHFVFGPGKGRESLVMGHYARGSRRVVAVRECPVHAPAGNAVAFALRDAYARAGLGPADPGEQPRARSHRRAEGTLKGVAVRVARGTPEIMTTLVVSAETDKGVRSATRRVLKSDTPNTSLHVNIHPRTDAFIFGRETRRVFGPDRLRETVAGVSFLISPTAFFQTNIAAAEILVRLVLDAVPLGASVVDLYAGAGLFALPLAARGHTVVAVEENRAAATDGEASRNLNRIAADRCRFVAESVESALARLPPSDVVVLDPPRDGCSADVLRGVFTTRRPRVAVYISCNPEALARDLREITRAGYTVASVQPVDMFPHTTHIETVVVLQRS